MQNSGLQRKRGQHVAGLVAQVIVGPLQALVDGDGRENPAQQHLVDHAAFAPLAGEEWDVRDLVVRVLLQPHAHLGHQVLEALGGLEVDRQ